MAAAQIDFWFTMGSTYSFLRALLDQQIARPVKSIRHGCALMAPS